MVAVMILQSANFQEKSLDLVYLHSTEKTILQSRQEKSSFIQFLWNNKDTPWNMPGLYTATTWEKWQRKKFFKQDRRKKSLILNSVYLLHSIYTLDYFKLNNTDTLQYKIILSLDSRLMYCI